MKKIIIACLVMCLISIMLNPQNIYTSFNNSLKICLFNLFPSLFPFLVISNLMTYYGFIDICTQYLSKTTSKLFSVNKASSYVLIMSLLSGSPSNSKYIKQLLDNNLITIQDANQLLAFTHYINPLFIIGGIGIKMFKSKTIGIMILTSHVLGGLLTGILLRKQQKQYIKYIPINSNNKSFINNLSSSLKDTINTLILIFGMITCSFILVSIIHSITNLPFSLFSIIEITSGINYIHLSNINLLYQIIIMTFLLSFGGFSIHMQVLCILNNKKIRYLPYFYSRIIHALISIFIIIILIKLIY